MINPKKIPRILKAPEIIVGLTFLVMSLPIVPIPWITRGDYYASLELTFIAIIGGLVFLIPYFIFKKF